MRYPNVSLAVAVIALALPGLASDAFADGLPAAGMAAYFAVYWVLPIVAGWLVALGTLLGRVGVGKFLIGEAACIGATGGSIAFLSLAPNPTALCVVGGVFGALVFLAHLVKLCVGLFTRATGGRNAEVLRRWWRYL